MKTPIKTTHPSLVRARIAAEKTGSRPIVRPHHGLLIMEQRATIRSGIGPVVTRPAYTHEGLSAVVNRANLFAPVIPPLTDSERRMRRCRKDLAFRRTYFAALRREEKKLVNPSLKTLAEITAAADSYSDRKNRLIAISGIREFVTGKKKAALVPEKITAGWLLPIDADQARKLGCKINMSGKDATHGVTRKNSYGIHENAVPAVKKNGKWVGFERADHHNWCRAFALASPDGRTLHVALNDRESALTLPEGHMWSHDANGVHILRTSDGMDYHPTGAEFMAGKVEKMLSNLEANSVARLAQKAAEAKSAAERAIFERDLPTTRVTLADSLAAGNCAQGSLAFAERKLHISREEIIAGSYLFSVAADRVIDCANGDTDKAKSACRRAWLRETTVSI